MRKDWALKTTEEMKKIRNKAEEQLPEPELLVYTANFFKGLADETRLRIVALLWIEDLCMCEIVDALEGASSTISHHLKIMEKGEIIVSRREGKFTIYSVNKERVSQIIEFIN
ncbi:ArsR family transcriptional regulator [Bacillus sp. HMF5848]|uniref:ArsR/SmtB family transcription factor n=1 Tax=Bacillus sp. HMF5848 TaxID=2495421 RepID=UPI000F76807B|nr:metalloregulator ArsR/SmtB family transcription factor [Bacillus sp. HMF5848]RSK25834.1 ArsR family transcriptional regulator [Bacillus sp. HMF5848]